MTVHDNKFLSFEFHLNSFCGNAQQHFYSTNKKTFGRRRHFNMALQYFYLLEWLYLNQPPPV
jgi:hypothetical protein